MGSVKLEALVHGLDNLSDDNDTDKSALRVAKNIDLTDKGQVSSMPSIKLLAAGDYHSLYCDNEIMLAAEGATLKLINQKTGEARSIYTLGSQDPVSYCRMLDGVAFSNRTTIGIYRNDEAMPIGIDTPAAPVISSNSIGGLFEGRYGVAITAVSADGEESGLSPIAFITLENGNGITVNLPAPADGVEYFNIYRTSHDGDALYHAIKHPSSLSQASVGNSQIGKMADTQNLDRMPAGTIIRHWRGRLLSAKNNVLWLSEPMRYGLTSRRHNFIQFSHRIIMLQGTDSGVYVGTSKGVYFLAGGSAGEWDVRQTGGKAPVPFCSAEIDLSELDPALQNIGSGRGAIWLSENGFVVGLPSGSLLEAQRNRIQMLQGEAGWIAVLGKRVRATTRASQWTLSNH